jgi:hypothetical protein
MQLQLLNPIPSLSPLTDDLDDVVDVPDGAVAAVEDNTQD